MAKKLYALESADIESTEVELEATPEVGEVSDAQSEVAEAELAVAEQATAIDDGMEAADKLEEVQDVIAAAAEGDGLDPVAAEAIRIATEAICASIGVTTSSVYALYATENFKSASSRKANTEIALEGVGTFLKDLWTKIKAALNKLWAKAKALWDKYIAGLGRVKRAIASMKVKVTASSGKLADKAYVEEAPASLVSAFAGKKAISTEVVNGYISNHKTLLASTDSFSGVVDANGVIDNTVSVGTEAAPLVGGVYNVITFKSDTESGSLSVTVEKSDISEVDTKLGLQVATKVELLATLKEIEGVIANTITFKAKYEKVAADAVKQLHELGVKINTESKADNVEKTKAARAKLSAYYKIQTKAPGFYADCYAYNVKLAKAVLGFVGFCVKQYK